MRRRTRSEAPPLDAETVLVLLLGDDAPVRPLRRMMIEGEWLRSPVAPWKGREAFLVREAARLGIARRFHADVGLPAFDFEQCTDVFRAVRERLDRRRWREWAEAHGESTDGLDDDDGWQETERRLKREYCEARGLSVDDSDADDDPAA